MHPRFGIRPSQKLAARKGSVQSVGLPLKKLSEHAALILGLVLSLLSLYDILVRKPEADRLNAIAQFNQVVNSAAKIRQELVQTASTGDPAIRLAAASMATPRVLNDIATARALLPTLSETDVGIPQLLILISESMTAGDTASAEAFIRRAVNQPHATPFLSAEALRAQGRFLFVMGRPKEARDAYVAGLNRIGDSIPARAARAFHLADLISVQFASGNCDNVETDMGELSRVLASQGVSAEARSQLVAAVSAQIEQFSGQQCPRPEIGLIALRSVH